MRFWATAIAVLLADQLSKLWVGVTMTTGQSIPVISGILNITYVRNRGAAFSILQGRSWFFLIMAAVVVAALIYYNYRYTPKPWGQYSLGLIVGGTAGNFLDRLFFRAVRDFISIGWFPVFNLADMAITTGGALIMLYILLQDLSGNKEDQEQYLS